MRPQAHGGSLCSGGFHGAGPGRPSSIFRQEIAGTVAGELELLRQVVQGIPVEVTERNPKGMSRTRWRTPTTMERIRAFEVLARMAGVWR